MSAEPREGENGSNIFQIRSITSVHREFVPQGTIVNGVFVRRRRSVKGSRMSENLFRVFGKPGPHDA